MKISDFFKKYQLQNRSGASLENAIKALISELQDLNDMERIHDFKTGVFARDGDFESSVDLLMDEYNYSTTQPTP